MRTKYVNPIMKKRDWPDPCFLTDANFRLVFMKGRGYCYATQPTRNPAQPMIRVAEFTRETIGDFDWAEGSGVLRPPSWAEDTENIWAPHAIVEDGRFTLNYSISVEPARGESKGAMAISVAISDSPVRFVDANDGELARGEWFSVIDSHLLVDPVSGKRLLYWGSCFQPIRVQEVNEAGHFVPGSNPTEVIYPEEGVPYKKMIEGAFVFYHPRFKKYYAFISGDDTWNTYGGTAYWAESPFGPFEEIDLILQSNYHWIGPGQGSVFLDHEDQYWFVYHAYKGSERHLEGFKRRYPLMDRLYFTQGGRPYFTNGSPTSTLQWGPVLN